LIRFTGKHSNTWEAFAVEIVLGSSGDATGAILARQSGTGVEFFFAMAAHELGRTDASVIGHLIDARAVIATQVGQTVVPIHLATFAFKRKIKQKKILENHFAQIGLEKKMGGGVSSYPKIRWDIGTGRRSVG
jgi:hypothetical protein